MPTWHATALVSACLLAAAVVFFLAFLVTGHPRELQSAVAMVVTCVPFMLAAYAHPGRLLHPLSLLGFTMLLGVAGQATYLQYFAADETRAAMLSGLDTLALSSGLLVLAAATASVAVGYLLPSRKRADEPGRLLRRATDLGLGNPSPRRTFWAIAVLCSLAAVSFLLYAPKVGATSLADLLGSQKRLVEVEGGLSSFGYYRWGISLAGLGFIMAAYCIARGNLRWRSRLGAVALCALAITTLFATFSSSRTAIAFTLAAAVFVTLAVRQREPSTVRVVAVGLCSILVLATLLGLRTVNQGNAPSVGDALGGSGIVDQAFASRDWLDVAPLSVVVRRVPDAYDFQYGKTLAYAFVVPVPRSVWPDKPVVRLGPLIGTPVFKFSSSRLTGDPPGIVGELWLNGGLLVVVVGMIAVGALLRAVDRWYRMVAATDGLSALLYGIFAVVLAVSLPTQDVVGAVTTLGQTGLVLVPVLFLVRGRGTQAVPSRDSISKGLAQPRDERAMVLSSRQRFADSMVAEEK